MLQSSNNLYCHEGATASSISGNVVEFNRDFKQTWSQFSTYLNPESIPLATDKKDDSVEGNSNNSAAIEIHSSAPSTSLLSRPSHPPEYLHGSGPIDIAIRNVVCAFRLPCHIDLRQLAEACCHVYFERSRGVVHKAMRSPKCYARIWSSGKVLIIGCQSEKLASQAARVLSRIIQSKFPKANRLCNFQITNIMATCRLPFGVKIEELASNAEEFRDANNKIEYEPELTIGLIWRCKNPSSTLRIHTTGSITITGAKSEENILTVLEGIYPVVQQYACPKVKSKEKRKGGGKRKVTDFTDSGDSEFHDTYDSMDELCDESDFSDDDF